MNRTKITKRGPHGRADKGWWIVTDCYRSPIYWGQLAKPGCGYGPSIGFDTKKEATEFAMEQDLLPRQYDADGWER